MQVTVNAFKIALAIFEDNFLNTFKTAEQKLLGSLKLAQMGPKINEAIEQFTTDGMVNVDMVREGLDRWMRVIGNKYTKSVDFGVFFEAMGVKPLSSSITKDDIDNFFDKIIPSVAGQNQDNQ